MKDRDKMKINKRFMMYIFSIKKIEQKYFWIVGE